MGAKTSDVGNSIRETLAKSDLESALSEYGELAIDHLFSDVVAKELPVISTLRAIAKTGLAIRDALFTRKLVTFLKSIESIDVETRHKFIERLEKDPKFNDRVGDYYAILLDRVDSMSKPALLGGAFKAFCEEMITALELHQIGRAIDAIGINELLNVEHFCVAHDRDTYGQTNRVRHD